MASNAPLMQLVDFFKSAAQGYGTEQRILLLHGPVGSSKSTMARLIKKGLEGYSKIDAGKCYTYSWRIPHNAPWRLAEHYLDCPMHEEPLLLIPRKPGRTCSNRSTKNCPMGERFGFMEKSAPSAARSTPI